jgi:hypothetical protein
MSKANVFKTVGLSALLMIAPLSKSLAQKTNKDQPHKFRISQTVGMQTPLLFDKVYFKNNCMLLDTRFEFILASQNPKVSAIFNVSAAPYFGSHKTADFGKVTELVIAQKIAESGMALGVGMGLKANIKYIEIDVILIPAWYVSNSKEHYDYAVPDNGPAGTKTESKTYHGFGTRAEMGIGIDINEKVAAIIRGGFNVANIKAGRRFSGNISTGIILNLSNMKKSGSERE